MGGGTKYPVKAFQIGGPLGGIVPAAVLKDLTLISNHSMMQDFCLDMQELFPSLKTFQ